MQTTRRQLLQGLGGLALLSAPAVMAVMPVAPKSGAIKLTSTDALLVVDVQNCFLPGGSLAVNDGTAIIPVINALAKSFTNIVLTQDWHTKDHVSFASQHAGKKAV